MNDFETELIAVLRAIASNIGTVNTTLEKLVEKTGGPPSKPTPSSKRPPKS